MAVRLEVHKPKEGARPSLPEFVLTPTAQRIFETLGAVHVLGDLGAVRGAPGLGKSTALREYARRNRSVRLFEVSGFARGKHDVLQMLCESFAITEQRRTYGRWMALFGRVQELASSGRMLLIFDEAQNLSIEAANTLRSLSDQTDVGVVFAGNRNVLGERSRGGTAADVWLGEMAQIKSRMSAWCEITGAEIGDVEAYLAACGITSDREDLIALLWDFATRPGGLRTVDKILRRVEMMDVPWPFTVGSLQAAVEALNLEMPGRLA